MPVCLRQEIHRHVRFIPINNKMKKIFYLLLAALPAVTCFGKSVNVTVANSSSISRDKEIVEVSMEKISAKLNLSKDAQIIVVDKKGEQVPYQITYDKKLIFPASVKAKSSVQYAIKAGTPKKYATVAYGKKYPERVDDVAWENDRIAFRTYGPALQATGEQAYGYDIWVKRASNLVVENRYAMELDKATNEKIKSLATTDPAASKALREKTSYHFDHGNGLDFYKVGPTLGAGTSAFLVDGKLVYPYCYATQEVLDNGPLRFTVKLVYKPLNIKGNSVTETRIISLDEGSQLNKAQISFSNMKETLPLVTGIVLHTGSKDYSASAQKGYIAYADPKDAENGQIYVAAVFPKAVKEAKLMPFTGDEAVKIKDGADGHVAAISNYVPGSKFTYYFGAGWNKWGFKTSAEWYKYVSEYAQKVRTPLTATIK